VTVHVLCFGNAWHGDDGLGAHVARRLAARPSPGVKVIDAGVAGLAALDWFAGCRRAIVVDALRTGGPPGVVKVLAADEVRGGRAASLHELGVAELLALVPAWLAPAPAPEIVVVGAEVGAVSPFVPGLSPAVARAVDEIVGWVERLAA
jgi:hydrogenase maturation protease